MQVAYKTGGTGKRSTYQTIKDNQIVAPHPSTTLDHAPDFVVYHEFVLTSRNFIRTVTEVRPEWLLEYAPAYYDPRTFTGELKRVFEGIQRRLGSSDARLLKKVRR